MVMKKVMSSLAALVVTSLWAGPKVTVIGDSYSTWGPLQPSGYAVAYDGNYNGVTSADQQYWKIFIDHIDGELCVLNAWSGSFLAQRGGPQQSFIDSRRLDNLGDADIVVICGGTNDAWGSDGGARVVIGEEKYADWTPNDLQTFFPALTYLVCEVKRRLPEADIVIVANSIDDYRDSGNTHRDTGIAPAYAEAMKTVAEHYGLCFVQCSGVEKNDYHPTVAGFATMGAQLCEVWDGYAAEKRVRERERKARASAFALVSMEPFVSVMDVVDTAVEEQFTANDVWYRFTEVSAPMTMTISRSAQLKQVLLVGGGGAGGNNCGGGGGAGAFVEYDWRSSPVELASGDALTVSVGAGGAATTVLGPGENGGDSRLQIGGECWTAAGGGGGGGGYNPGDNLKGRDGGSGGGGGGGFGQIGSAGNALNGSYGFAGGNGVSAGMPPGGGGGGAGSIGIAANGKIPGGGGAGKISSITGEDIVYAGGGGGGIVEPSGDNVGAVGGAGGGGNGAKRSVKAEAGTDGLGGGGGGGGGSSVPADGGAGGSGVVILRFDGAAVPQLEAMVSATNSPFKLTVDALLSSVGMDASSADVYLAYGVGAVGERVKIATLAEGESVRYEVAGLEPNTDYVCELTVENNAATPGRAIYAGETGTLDVEKMQPVPELSQTLLDEDRAGIRLSLAQVGMFSSSAIVQARLIVGARTNDWETLAEDAVENWSREMLFEQLESGVACVYEVKVTNDRGFSATAQLPFTPLPPEPDGLSGRSVAVEEQVLDATGEIVSLKLAIGYAGSVYSNTKLYVAYGSTDAGPETNGWERFELVAMLTDDARTYDYMAMPSGWGTQYHALRFFTVSESTVAPASTAYCQDGIHAQWDAIDNAGVGQHVDSASTWVNLVDPSYELSYQGGTANFGEKGFASKNNTSYFIMYTATDWWTEMGNNYTWEAYVTFDSNLGNTMTLMGSLHCSGLHTLFGQYNGGTWGFYEMAYSRGIGDIGPDASAIPHDGSTRVHLAYVVTPTGATLYKDGEVLGGKVEAMPEFAASGDLGASAQFMLGSGYESVRRINANIHAVRLYKTALSQEAIRANFALDEARYGGGGSRMALGKSDLVEKEIPRAETVVESFAPNSVYFNVTLKGIGFGATKADVYLRYGTADSGNLDKPIKLGTLAKGESLRYLVKRLEPGVAYNYEIATANNATVPVTWTGTGTFATEITPLPAVGDMRTVTITPGKHAATVSLGNAIVDTTFSLYVCYGATPSADGTNGWDVVRKLGDFGPEATAFEWRYPFGWGNEFAVARFVLVGTPVFPVHEYLESTGTQYVFTGLKPKMSMSYAGKAQYLGRNVLSGERWATLYGCYVTGDQCLFWYPQTNSFYFNNPGNYSVGGIGTAVCEFSTTEYDASRDPRTSVTANGNTASGNNNWFATLKAESMPLFAFDYNGTITTCNSDIRLYNFKAYDGGVLVRDFVPIVYDGEPVLFDRANGDVEHGQIYRRADAFTVDFKISETTTGEVVYGAKPMVVGASEALYHNSSMRTPGMIWIIR